MSTTNECPHGFWMAKGCPECSELERAHRSETTLHLETVSLRAAIRAYGQHTVDCTSHTSRNGKWLECNCGWDECEFNPENG